MTKGLKCPCDMKSLFFTYEGRLNRQPFNIIIGSMFLLASFMCMFLPFAGEVVVFLIALAVTACPVIRRLHDREYSGVWYTYALLIAALAVILIIAPFRMIYDYFMLTIYAQTSSIVMEPWNPAHALAFLVGLGLMTYMAVIGWFMAELCFFRGTEGPNEYGPDPLDRLDPIESCFLSSDESSS